MIKKTQIERFEEKYIPEALTGCFLWIGAIHSNWGYGSFRYNGKTIKAHRASYQIYKGEITNNLQVLHKCDNPACVNPNHLFLGTNVDNRNDMNKKNRANPPSGSNHWNAKITKDQVIKMRELFYAGEEITKLSIIYSLNKKHIQDICKRRSWRHVL